VDQQDPYELGRTKCNLSVVSDLKTDRASCCFRQRRSGSDNLLMYGFVILNLHCTCKTDGKTDGWLCLLHVLTEKPLIRY